MNRDSFPQNKNKTLILRNDRGLSLVELLVAMSILMIVAIAIYSAIIVSAKTNAKANTQYKATSLSQNVMEGLKANTLDNVLEEVATPAVTFIPNSSIDAATTVGFLKDNVTTTDGEGNITVEKSSDNAYCFFLDHAKMDDRYFDVFVKLDADRYSQEATDTSIKASTYNTNVMIEIPDMDSNYDAIFSQSLEYDTECFTGVGGFYGLDADDDDNAIMLMNKTIHVELGSKESWGGTTSYNRATYTYRAAGFSQAYERTYPISLDNDLRNVFIFFRPSYGTLPDEIIIDNPEDLEVNVYVIMMDSADAIFLGASALKLNVYLNESQYASASKAIMHTNLHLPSVSDTGIYSYDLTYGNISFKRGKFVGDVVTDTVDANATNLPLSPLTGDTASDRIFDVTVYVYDCNKTQGLLEDGKGYGEYTWEQLFGASGRLNTDDTRSLATMEGTIRD